MKTSLSQRREVADKMLAYLKQNNISSCNDSHTILTQIANALNIELFMLWKGYELLRIMARVELNSINGRKGFHVLDYNPLSVSYADRPLTTRCEPDNCPILRLLQKKWNISIISNSSGDLQEYKDKEKTK